MNILRTRRKAADKKSGGNTLERSGKWSWLVGWSQSRENL